MVLVAMEVNSYFGMKYKKIKIKYSLVSAGIENCEQPVTPGIGGGGAYLAKEVWVQGKPKNIRPN